MSNPSDPYRNPWKQLSSRVVYKNPWLKVREDDVITPSGEQGIYGVVESKVATGVVAINERNEIYLVGQYRYPIERYSWEIIEGGADTAESPLDAAKRELQEEAGLVATDWSPLGGEIHLSNCFSAEVGYLFVARGLTQGRSSPDSTEQLQVKKLPLAEALALVDSGEITDGLSIIALLRIARAWGLLNV